VSSLSSSSAAAASGTTDGRKQIDALRAELEHVRMSLEQISVVVDDDQCYE
jgi:hypothetical protein